jgi:hypothetical protein
MRGESSTSVGISHLHEFLFYYGEETQDIHQPGNAGYLRFPIRSVSYGYRLAADVGASPASRWPPPDDKELISLCMFTARLDRSKCASSGPEVAASPAFRHPDYFARTSRRPSIDRETLPVKYGPGGILPFVVVM